MKQHDYISRFYFLLSFSFTILQCCIHTNSFGQTHHGLDIDQLKKELKIAVESKNSELLKKVGFQISDYYNAERMLDLSTENYKKMAALAKKWGAMDLFYSALNAESYMYWLQGSTFRADSIANLILEADKVEEGLYHAVKLLKGGILLKNGQYEEAKDFFDPTLNFYMERQDTLKIIEIYRSLALIETNQFNQKGAIQYYLSAAEYCNNLKTNQYVIFNIYSSITNHYINQDNLYKAHEYAKKILDMHDQIYDLKYKHLYENLYADVLFELGEYEKAKMYNDQALQYFVDNKIQIYLPRAMVSKIKNEMHVKNYPSARRWIDSLYVAVKKESNNANMYSYYKMNWSYFLEIKNWDKLKKYLEEGEAVVLESQNKSHRAEFNKYWYDYYKAVGDKKNALAKFESYVQVSDSMYQVNQLAIVHDLEARYAKDQQEKKILALNKQGEISAIELRQQKVLSYVGLIFTCLLGLLALGLFRLFTRIKKQKEKIAIADKEKDTLLREIHHRVKNNLQVISSLLSLQTDYIQDDTALNALREGQDRVQSMALIHQDLYQTDNLKGVDADEYFEQLVDNLFDSYNINEEYIHLHTEIEPIQLDVDTMIPLGLVVNELLSNSLKHAFKDKKDGLITIKLKEANKQLVLEVADNGKGIKSLEEMEGKSFGYELIKAFAQKLKADIEYSNKEGFHIILKIQNYTLAA